MSIIGTAPDKDAAAAGGVMESAFEAATVGAIPSMDNDADGGTFVKTMAGATPETANAAAAGTVAILSIGDDPEMISAVAFGVSMTPWLKTGGAPDSASGAEDAGDRKTKNVSLRLGAAPDSATDAASGEAGMS